MFKRYFYFAYVPLKLKENLGKALKKIESLRIEMFDCTEK